MKKSEFILDLRHEGLGEAWANRIAVKVEEAGVPWDPEVDLRPCPNPECSNPGALRVQWSNLNGWVVCDGCSVEGPAAPSEFIPREDAEAEAIRLWNLLPRTQDEVPAGDPGEPELPRELKICTSSSNDGRAIDLVWENSTFDDFEQHLAVYREAAARYKALGSYLDELRQRQHTSDSRGYYHECAALLAAILADEREKLR